MNIDSVSHLLPTVNKTSVEFTKPAESSFSSWLGDQVLNTNHQLNTADNALNQLAAGRAENLHETMITLEQAKLSFQYLEQIRNRLMSAYQDLLREQI